MTTTIASPVCPPNPDAECICGDVLADHISVHELCPLASGTFQLVGGDSTECPDLTSCSICEVDLCTEHSPEFTSCAGGDGIHHLACQYDCASCTACAREERGW